ncbi:restriction endonuclease subunit S [Tenacibaculum piscium]|nr:restriction endonuclease subunit S [Tenacibaculum piscium]
MKKYSTYKNSGVEWLGEIPEHWEVVKLKYLSEIFNGDSLNESLKKKYESDDLSHLAYISSKDINVNNSVITYNNGLRIPKDNIKLKIAPKNSSLLCIEGGSAGRKIAFTNQEVCFVNKLACFSIKKDNNPQYLFFTLKSNPFQIQFKSSMSGMIGGVAISSINNFIIPIPPLSEQTKIAEFLDDKTEKIDEAIAIKTQQINLLKERKQILIHKAVTRGLDTNVKLKNSGVEWIGEIPVHWEVLPGFMVYKENKSKNDGMKENVVLSLSYGNIIIKPKEKLIGLVPESFETYQIVKPSDIIIRCMDLQNDKTSLRTGIAVNHGIITSAYLNLNIINNNISEYIYNFLHSLDTTKVLYKFGTGLRQNLSFRDFKHLQIPIPPKEEQQKIVDYIKYISEKIATAIGLKSEEISTLKEYKSSLINSVVTGKVRVC